MRLAELLRLTAIGIAVMCWLDPPIVVVPKPPVPVDIAIVHSELDELPASARRAETVGSRAAGVADALVAALGADGDARVVDAGYARYLPCDAQRPCVVVATSRPALHVPNDRRGPTFLVRVGEPLSPNVSVTGLTVSSAHPAAEGNATVGLQGRGVEGQRTRLRLMDGSAVVGEAVHDWSSDGDASVDVPWWPLAAGTRTLTVDAETADVRETDVDNEAKAVATVSASPWSVLFVERRPSWASTFARRALESDPRFAVEARTDLAPGVSARTSPVPPLEAAQLDQAHLVVVGAPEALDARDVGRLDRFVRQRGGTLILAPDRPFTGAITQLLVHRWRAHTTPEPTRIGGFSGREWLVADAVSMFDTVLASGESGPVVVATPLGSGWLVVVGAMDAWKERGDGTPFARFWRDTAARFAAEAGPAVRVTAEPRLAVAGDEIAIRVAARGVRPSHAWKVNAEIACGSTPAVSVRLWPDHAAGSFLGRARAPSGSGTCVVTGHVADRGEGRTDVIVTPIASGSIPAVADELETAVARTGGVTTSDRDLEPLVAALRALASDLRTPEARYPMRSPWWLAPLLACLAAEWWLRRRAGLR